MQGSRFSLYHKPGTNNGRGGSTTFRLCCRSFCLSTVANETNGTYSGSCVLKIRQWWVLWHSG